MHIRLATVVHARRERNGRRETNTFGGYPDDNTKAFMAITRTYPTGRALVRLVRRSNRSAYAAVFCFSLVPPDRNGRRFFWDAPTFIATFFVIFFTFFRDDARRLHTRARVRITPSGTKYYAIHLAPSTAPSPKTAAVTTTLCTRPSSGIGVHAQRYLRARGARGQWAGGVGVPPRRQTKRKFVRACPLWSFDCGRRVFRNRGRTTATVRPNVSALERSDFSIHHARGRIYVRKSNETVRIAECAFISLPDERFDNQLRYIINRSAWYDRFPA